MRKNEEIDSRQPKPENDDPGRQKNPDLRAFVKPRTVMKRFKKIGPSIRGLQNGAVRKIDLNLVSVFRLNLGKTTRRLNVDSVDIFPVSDPGDIDGFRRLKNRVHSDLRRFRTAALCRWLNPRDLLFQLKYDAGHENQ